MAADGPRPQCPARIALEILINSLENILDWSVPCQESQSSICCWAQPYPNCTKHPAKKKWLLSDLSGSSPRLRT